MGRFSGSLLRLALTVALYGGCSTGGQVRDGQDGLVHVVVGVAPADAFCLRVGAIGSQSVVKTFDLTPGQASLFEMNRLPVGSVRFVADVFGVACAGLTGMDVPRWVSDPVTLTILPGVPAQLNLLLLRNGRVRIGIDFEDGGVDASLPDGASDAGRPPMLATFEKRVASGDDDAEEYTSPTSGGVDITSSDLEMTRDIPVERSQVIGVRFPGVAVPPGATIISAHLQFTTKLQADGNGIESEPAATVFTAKGQAADDPPAFLAAGPGSTEISGRPATAAETTWSNVPRWMVGDAAGADQRTPSLAAIVQEIVNRPGWASGNAMVFVVTGTGTRSAHSFDTASGTKAPLLHIDYATGPYTPPEAGPEVGGAPSPDAAGDASLAPDVGSDAAPGTSSQSAFMVPSGSGTGVTFQSILTVGDSPASGPSPNVRYRLAGEPDGLGAFDNGDGTFTLLVNHELGAGSGSVRRHGYTGSFVSKWVIRKSDGFVQSGEDLIEKVALWNRSLGTFFAPAAGIPMTRLCSADLPAKSALFHQASGLGFDGRIFFSGEEAFEGRAFAHGLDGTTYELARLGRGAWENVVPNPGSGDKTVVVALDDAAPGQVYVYVGTKTNAGNPVERAGLQNGTLFGVRVPGLTIEDASNAPAAAVPFELASLGDLSSAGTGMTNLTAFLESVSDVNAVTKFARPEDGAWDPSNPNDFYFVTTSTNRLWRLRFTDLANPAAGGTIEVPVNGQGMFAPDNLAVSSRGEVLIQEDPGNQSRNAKIWRYRIATGAFEEIAQSDPVRFNSASGSFIGTQDEESSGIIDATDIFGPGHFLLDIQVHQPLDAELVSNGQLMHMFLPPPAPVRPPLRLLERR